MDHAALAQAAAQGLANGGFEEGAEEMPQLLEEFYPEPESQPAAPANAEKPKPSAGLGQKLNGKAAQVADKQSTPNGA